MACKTLLILIAFSLFPAFAETQLTYGRNIQQEIRVSSEAGDSAATLTVTQIHMVLPAGRVEDGSMFSLFVPSSRLFWWGYRGSNGMSGPEADLKAFMDSFTFSVHPDQIACFWPNGRTLWFRTSEMRVSSMDEGVLKLRKLLPEELPKILSGATREFQDVTLSSQAVGETFLEPKDFDDIPTRLRVVAVDRSASGWRIEIRNDRGESKTVILSRDFKTVTSASQ